MCVHVDVQSPPAGVCSSMVSFGTSTRKPIRHPQPPSTSHMSSGGTSTVSFVSFVGHISSSGPPRRMLLHFLRNVISKFDLTLFAAGSKNVHSLVITCKERVYKFLQPDKVTTFKWMQVCDDDDDDVCMSWASRP
jgi:hypothetical protein